MSRRDVRDERGAILVLFAGFLPLAIILMTFVVDLGNWWVHKRHLQTQADAAALASVGAIKFPCQDQPIIDLARDYSGDEVGDRNPQLGGTSPADIHMVVNSPTFYGQTEVEPDPPPSTSPCAARMVDVKMTETDLPWFFRAASLDFSNATARVSIRQLDSLSGLLPVGVPDVNPKKAAAIFVDEDTGAVLGTRELVRGTAADGVIYWDNAGAPLSLTVNADRVGVRIALSGGDSLTCGQPRVECYDAGAANGGLLRIRGYDATPAVTAGQTPRAREVFMVPGTCDDGYFVANGASCTIGLRARLDWGVVPPPASAKVTASVGGVAVTLAYDAIAGLWGSDVNIPAAGGPSQVDLSWEQTAGTVAGATCSNKNNNPCKGAYVNVHRVFSAAPARSGPVTFARVDDQNGQFANYVPRGTAHDFVVTIGVTGNLEVGTLGDPPVVLRVGGGGSQNQTVDCDPDYSKLKDELALGCRPEYTRNKGETCPTGAAALWGTPEPWNCVAIQTGQAANQVPAGLNLRILGDEKPATCTNPNHWDDAADGIGDADADGQPDYEPGDPRIMPVFLVPFGSFQGSGSGTVPVQEFAFFYVTGWTGQGGGFANPCEGNGDDPVPGGDSASIVGHFIKYVQNPNNGGAGQQPCDFDPSSLGGCVAVMTK